MCAGQAGREGGDSDISGSGGATATIVGSCELDLESWVGISTAVEDRTKARVTDANGNFSGAAGSPVPITSTNRTVAVAETPAVDDGHDLGDTKEGEGNGDLPAIQVYESIEPSQYSVSFVSTWIRKVKVIGPLERRFPHAP